MEKKTYRNLLALTLAALVALGAYSLPRQHHLSSELAEARQALQEDSLVASGWMKVPSSPASSVPLPSLEEESRAAEQAGTDIGLVLNASSEAASVLLPRPSPSPPPPTQPSPPSDPPVASTESNTPPQGETSPSLPDSAYSLTFSPRIELRADLGAADDLFVVGNQFVKYHLTYPPYLNEEGESLHPLKDVKLSLGPKLTTALSYYHSRPSKFTATLRPPRHWRGGWSAGIGLGYDPVGGEVSPQVAVIYGVQF